VWAVGRVRWRRAAPAHLSTAEWLRVGGKLRHPGASPCQVQCWWVARGRQIQEEEKKGTFLWMSDIHNLFSPFLSELWKNHRKFCFVLFFSVRIKILSSFQ